MPRRPSPGNIVYPYGMRWHPVWKRWQMHYGEDIGWGNGAGTTLVTPQRAQLIDYRDRGDWGMQARLRAGNVEHRLAHTARLAHGADVGEWFDEGAAIAVMGETGLAAGVHVHWEVLVDGQFVDPAAWLANPAGVGATTPFPNEEDDMTPDQAKALAETKAKVDVLFDFLLPGISGVKSAGKMARVHQETWAFAKAAAGEPDVVVDYDRLASAIVEAGGAAPTAAQIAKAVNDDAARRLAG